MRPALACAALLLAFFSLPVRATAQAPSDVPLADVLERMAGYVERYGEQASFIVARERYTQEVVPGRQRPRRLVAEFAIVKTGNGWVGFRDVIEVDGEPVEDRRDRLLQAFTSSADAVSEATRIANESARFNIGPIARNFNVPTAAMFFFTRRNLARFTFKRKGRDTIDGIETWEIGFKETTRPTLVVTKRGRDVPTEGTIWVSPSDGVVVRTSLHLRNFADQVAMGSAPDAPTAMRPPVNPNVPTGGREAIEQSQSISVPGGALETRAEMDVDYRRHPSLGLWLPSSMIERYSGPVPNGTRPPFVASVTTRATYADFKRFEASTTIKVK